MAIMRVWMTWGFGLSVIGAIGGCTAQHAGPPPAQTAIAPNPTPTPASPAAAVAPAGAESDPAAFFKESAGPGGGWLIGASADALHAHRTAAATEADRRAEASPAATADIQRSDTADLNHDGFVTLDEVLAMRRAGLGDEQIIDRLRKTGQRYAISDHQQQYLLDRGVSRAVVDAIRSLQPQPAATSTIAG